MSGSEPPDASRGRTAPGGSLRRDPGAEEASDPASTREQRYFLAIEEHFVRLRGAPMLLSPGDWRVARGWLELEVPLAVVHRVLERVFEQRRERGAKRRVLGLRYFDDPVRTAWAEILELRGPEGPRVPAAEVDARTRLEALAGGLPAEVRDRERWRERILALGAGEAGPAEIERALAILDRELLAAARDWLDDDELGWERAEVERALATLRGRLDAQGLAETRERLLGRRLRERLSLPELSLFPAGRPS